MYNYYNIKYVHVYVCIFTFEKEGDKNDFILVSTNPPE